MTKIRDFQKAYDAKKAVKAPIEKEGAAPKAAAKPKKKDK